MSEPPSTSTGPWGERAETVDSPRSLTVLGVDRADPGLPDRLPERVPDDADLVVTDRPEEPPSDVRLRAYLRNPAIALRWLKRIPLAIHDLTVYRTLDRDAAWVALEQLEHDRRVEVVDAGEHPTEGAADDRLSWAIGGWIVSLLTLVGLLYALLHPVAGTVLLLTYVAVPIAYLAVRSGARMEVREEKVFERLRERVAEGEYRRPVVVVGTGLARGIADRAKDERIRTERRRVSPTTIEK